MIKYINAPDDIDGSEGLLAIVIFNQPIGKPGRNHQFFTDKSSPLQLGLIKYAGFDSVNPHRHLPHTRTSEVTQEVLFVRKGSICVTVYTSTGIKVDSVLLRVGDCIMLVGGAHSLNAYSDAEVIECKTGPYHSREVDKIDIPTQG